MIYNGIAFGPVFSFFEMTCCLILTFLLDFLFEVTNKKAIIK